MSWTEIEVSKLKEAEYNPRIISKYKLELLKHSLEKDPEFIKARPLIVNQREDGSLVVACGNQKLKAARELMWQTIPCVLVKISLKLEKIWNIKDNNSYGEFNDELQSDVMKAIYESDLDATLTGYDEVEIEEIIQELYDKPIVEKFKSKMTKLINCPECGAEIEVK